MLCTMERSQRRRIHVGMCSRQCSLEAAFNLFRELFAATEVRFYEAIYFCVRTLILLLHLPSIEPGCELPGASAVQPVRGDN
jgi:hypothetical protein